MYFLPQSCHRQFVICNKPLFQSLLRTKKNKYMHVVNKMACILINPGIIDQMLALKVAVRFVI